MKMESDFEPITGTLQLQYDAQAQKIFDEASKKMDPRFDFNSSPIRKMMGEEADEDIGKPLRLLAELGASASRTIQVRPMAMQSLLNLTCWMALRLSDDQQPIKPLDSVVVLLSSVTPIPVLPVDLPPASEVFDNASTNPGAWSAYETLRLWKKDTMPHLYAIQAHYLWHELRRIRRLNPTLKTLLSSLDTETILLRMAVEALALQEISGTTRKRRKK